MDRVEELLALKDGFDILQTGEIERGRNEGLDVSKYSNVGYSHYLMRQIRKGLESGFDLTPYVGYGISVLHEIRRSMMEGINIIPYVAEGYDGRQLESIRFALSAHVDIKPYLKKSFHGACIRQIALGLMKGLDVSVYADERYSWRKMRELRKGLEKRIDVKWYANPRYSYWQMHEIRKGLEAGIDVSGYAKLMFTAKAMNERRQDIMAANETIVSGNAWDSYDDGSCRMHISKDGLGAYIEVMDKNWKPDAYELACLAKRYGIVFGINNGGLPEVAKQIEGGNSWIMLAVGRRGGSGIDGRYEWNFQPALTEMPVETEDGNADYSGIKWFERVSRGQTLATYYPAEVGAKGMTVKGTVINGTKGKDLPHLTGHGFRLLEDGRTYVAAEDGHVRLKKYRMHVEPLLVLDGLDIDNRKIFFDGSVLVSGNVDGDFEIEATGDVVIDGVIRSSSISSGRNVLVRQGMKGAYGRGSINARGSVIGKYFEDSMVTAGGNIYLTVALNSSLEACGGIVSYGRHGGIVGGRAVAQKGFCLSNVGNDVGRATLLVAGANEKLTGEYEKMVEQDDLMEEEIEQLKETYNGICRRYSPQERGGIEMYVKLEKSIQERLLEKKQYEARLEIVKSRINKAVRSRIIVEGRLYDNVTVVFNQAEYHPRIMSNAAISYRGGEFHVESI